MMELSEGPCQALKGNARLSVEGPWRLHLEWGTSLGLSSLLLGCPLQALPPSLASDAGILLLPPLLRK
jgi:hypothetical protein